MDNLCSDEKRVLNHECPPLRFNFEFNVGFVLTNLAETNFYIEKMDPRIFSLINDSISKLNNELIRKSTIKIDESALVSSPTNRIWQIAYFSIFLIGISFIIEIIPAYYSDENFLSYFGFIIMCIALILLLIIIIKQLFFCDRKISEVLKDPKVISEIRRIIIEFIGTMILPRVDNSIVFEYKPPYLIEVSIT